MPPFCHVSIDVLLLLYDYEHHVSCNYILILPIIIMRSTCTFTFYFISQYTFGLLIVLLQY